MKGAAARRGAIAGALVFLCAACAPTTYSRAGTTQGQGERDLEACRLEGLARLAETLPRIEDYSVDVSAFERGPYDLETRLRFAAQGAVERAYEDYLSEQLRAYVPACMARKGYRQGQLGPAAPTT
jgi:pyruvate-formate lyase